MAPKTGLLQGWGASVSLSAEAERSWRLLGIHVPLHISNTQAVKSSSGTSLLFHITSSLQSWAVF